MNLKFYPGAIILVAAFCLFQRVSAADPVPADKGKVDTEGKFSPATPGQAPKASPAVAVEALGDGKFKVGSVSFDQKARTITFPAEVNMRTGTVEYALVTRDGKRHEAIFTTPVAPEHIHQACLLLGITAVKLSDMKAKEKENGVRVEVCWDTNGPERRLTLAECVGLSDGTPGQASGKTLTAGTWFYSGSHLDESGFAASREGSIISIIHDGVALISNPRDDKGNDDIHVANTALLPEVGSPVRVVITLPKVK